MKESHGSRAGCHSEMTGVSTDKEKGEPRDGRDGLVVSQLRDKTYSIQQKLPEMLLGGAGHTVQPLMFLYLGLEASRAPR